MSIDEIRTLISESKIKDAIYKMRKFAEDIDDAKLLNSVITISATYQLNEDERVNQTLSRDEYLLSYSKINRSLLGVLEEIKCFNEDLQHNKKSDELTEDKIYEMLCKLNFKEQVKYFNLICKSKEKSLIPFVVRANDDFGQRWLCTRLIKKYQANAHEPIPVDLEASACDLQGLVESLIRGILKQDAWQKWQNRLNRFTAEEKIKESRRELGKLLHKRTESATQFVIIKNAFTHIDSKSDKFLHFCNLLIELDNWMYDTDYKCILIFVEKRPDQYTCQEYLCTHMHDSFEAMKMVDKEKLKIVGLQEIKEFSESDIKEWLEDSDLHDQIRDKLLNNGKSFTELIAKKHPELVIREICEELNVTFQEKWIKH